MRHRVLCYCQANVAIVLVEKALLKDHDSEAVAAALNEQLPPHSVQIMGLVAVPNNFDAATRCSGRT